VFITLRGVISLVLSDARGMPLDEARQDDDVLSAIRLDFPYIQYAFLDGPNFNRHSFAHDSSRSNLALLSSTRWRDLIGPLIHF
jgi:hypothetical protein